MNKNYLKLIFAIIIGFLLFVIPYYLWLSNQ